MKVIVSYVENWRSYLNRARLIALPFASYVIYVVMILHNATDIERETDFKTY